MNVLRRILVGLGSMVVVALVFALASPKAVHAVVSTLVTVVNTSANPVLTEAVDNPAFEPFLAQLCLTSVGTFYSCSGFPSSFTVPSTTPNGATVAQLVIEYVSGTCITLGGQIASISLGAANPNGANPSYYFVPGPQIYTGAATVIDYAQSTRIYAAPSTFVYLGEIATPGTTNANCLATVSGHFATQ